MAEGRDVTSERKPGLTARDPTCEPEPGREPDRTREPDRMREREPTLERAARAQALQDALRQAVLGIGTSREAQQQPTSGAASGKRDRERRRWLAKASREQDLEFVRTIESTAELIRQARDVSGVLVYRTDARYRLLAAVDRGGGWPSISEVARTLRVSKQAARQHVIAAARAGVLELVPDPFDRRSIQIGLTPSGKNELAAGRTREIALSEVVLRGLGVRERRLVAHVLRVMGARLLRAERDRPRRVRDSRTPRGESPAR